MILVIFPFLVDSHVAPQVPPCNFSQYLDLEKGYLGTILFRFFIHLFNKVKGDADISGIM